MKAVILASGLESQAFALADPVPLLVGEEAREVSFNKHGYPCFRR